MTGIASFSLSLVLLATLLAALSGTPAFFTGRWPRLRQYFSMSLMVIAAMAGLSAAGTILLAGQSEIATLFWSLPFGTIAFHLDPLAAFFLLPIFIVTPLAALYGRHYWPAEHKCRSERQLSLFSGVLTAAMTLVVIAHNVVLFLIAWEIMALAAWFLLTAEDDKREVRRSGTVYLIATHCGTLLLIPLFLLLGDANLNLPAAGTLDASSSSAPLLFFLALIGFGVKAGIMPLHIWLPAAHANAPSHVSAVMSGVMLKIGLYGIIRFLTLHQHLPIWWGWVLLALGTVSALLAIISALGQHDLKRLLAYSSIENIGIITMGLGSVIVATDLGLPQVALLAAAALTFHILNHALFKPLLFFGAGSIMHATGTRNLERLGGLHRRMPATATLFLIGTLAISTLPPLNGFASEFLLYTSLFTAVATGSTFAVLALAIPLVALALVGGLALTCFVKVYSMTFSGHPRSQEAAEAHESGRFILIPMLILAILSLAAGIIPLAPVWLLDAASQAIIPSTMGSKFHFPPISLLSGVMGGFLALLGILLLVIIVYLLRRHQGEAAGTTWDCGYLAPSSRIQYTPSSFSELLIKLLSGIVKPRFHHPVLRGIFPTDTLFTSTVPERELKGVIFPLMSGIREHSARLRALQHGQLHLYILYILATLVILLTWAYL